MKKLFFWSCLFSSVALSNSAQSAVIQWQSSTDAGTNTQFSNGANWVGGTAPVDGDSVVLGPIVAGGSLNVNLDAANASLSGIDVTAGGYTISRSGSNVINLGGNINYTAGGASLTTVTAPIVLTQNATINITRTVGAQTPLLRIDSGSGSAGVSGGNFGITINGAADQVATPGGGEVQVQTNLTYTGDTVVNQGSINFRLNNPAMAGKLVLNNLSGGMFINNVNVSLGALDGVATAGILKGGSNSRSLTIGTNNGDGVYNGAINMAGGGGSNVIKVGTGTQTFTGAVTSTGAGQVNGGRMNVNGTWSNGVVVGASGTLGGTGSIAGAVTGAGLIDPGMANSIGTLTVGSVTPTGTLRINLDGAGAGTADLLNVTGALSIAGATVDFSTLGTLDDASYIFASYGTLTGTFVNVLNTPSNYLIDYAFNNGVSSNNIALVAVPEPSSMLLVVGAGLYWAKRRRNRMANAEPVQA